MELLCLVVVVQDLEWKYKVENKHPLIQEGEKIKFMYLKTPNPLHENIISFFGELPKEFGIEKYVD